MSSFLAIPTLAWFNFSMPELLIIAVIMLLIFGRRLPEVGKSLGKGIVEFKKGLKGVEEELNNSVNAPAYQPPQPPQQQQWGQQPPAQIPAAQPAPGAYAQPAPQQYADTQQANAYAPPVGPQNTVSRAEPAH